MGHRRRARTTAPAPRNEPGRAHDRGERLERILRRDGGRCVWCGRRFEGLVTPTTEHVVPRVKGGPSWIENEVAACRRCNGRRGHRTPASFAAESIGLGHEPDLGVLLRSLRSLLEAIERHGGQRRARPYVTSQLRRLERMTT